MKHFAILLASLFILGLSANAQEQTLLGSTDVRFGAFGGTGVYYTDFMGDGTALMGGQGALLINKTMYLGVGGYCFGRRPDAGAVYTDGAWRESRYEGAYAGLLMGAILYSDRVVHGMADVLIGGGGITRAINDWDEDEWDDDHDYEQPTDGYFVIQPMGHVEVNLVRWMRVDLGAGYRFVTDVEKFGLENKDVAGPVAGLGFRFGKF